MEFKTRATHEITPHDQTYAGSYGSYASNQHKALYLDSQMTPPTTPTGSQENFTPEPAGPPIFHNFLRAFYPFNPGYTISDSSVTLSLEEGDVVLVHSVHTNGWADGTLLVSGARGWLPTNYCEAYEPDDMRSLLKALLNFWALLRSTSINDNKIFGNQEFMKGIIAGVRFLLVRYDTLLREGKNCGKPPIVSINPTISAPANPLTPRNELPVSTESQPLFKEVMDFVKAAGRCSQNYRP